MIQGNTGDWSAAALAAERMDRIMSGAPRPASGRFPYLDHRTVAEVAEYERTRNLPNN